MQRKDGKPKAAPGTMTRTINGVKHRRCESCDQMRPVSCFGLYRWECSDCVNKQREAATRLMVESMQGLTDMGYSQYDVARLITTGTLDHE